MNCPMLTITLLLAATCNGAPVNTATTTPNLPTKMTRAHASTLKGCKRPNFGCIESEQVSVPRPKLGEALVKMAVSSVNPSDLDMEESAGSLIGTLGADFAGSVVAVGPFCSRLKVGDNVWGVTLGAYAEYAIVICAVTGKLDDGIDPKDVGTLPEVSLTSSEAFKKAGAPWDVHKPLPGQNLTVLVTSGSGGTGFVALQLAKFYGANYVITATSSNNADFCKTMGADLVVDYHKQNVFDALGNNTIDIVYDNYGAKGTADRAMRVLKPGGAFVFLPGKGGALSKNPKLGVKQINFGLMIPSVKGLDAMLMLYKDGTLKSHVEVTFPLTNVSGAFDVASHGQTVGKMAIAM